MKVTKHQLKIIIREEKRRMMEYGPVGAEEYNVSAARDKKRKETAVLMESAVGQLKELHQLLQAGDTNTPEHLEILEFVIETLGGRV